MNAIQVFSYNGSNVTFSNENGMWVNATEMAKPFGKKPIDWLRQQSTNEFLETLFKVRNTEGKVSRTHFENQNYYGFVVTERGGANPCSWFHEAKDKNYGSITDINWDDVPDFDLFTMSSPCQDFSSAGKQAGGEEGSGTRSSLLWECRKAIVAKKPKFVVFENVPALLHKKFLPGFLKWVAELESYGYSNFYQILNAADYGTPQHRKRVFMVSILNAEHGFEFPKPFPLEKRLRDVLEDEVGEEQVARILDHRDRKVAEGCGFRPQFTPSNSICGTITGNYGNAERRHGQGEAYTEITEIQVGRKFNSCVLSVSHLQRYVYRRETAPSPPPRQLNLFDDLWQEN